MSHKKQDEKLSSAGNLLVSPSTSYQEPRVGMGLMYGSKGWVIHIYKIGLFMFTSILLILIHDFNFKNI